jgi:histidinol-phosphate aminotransferase
LVETGQKIIAERQRLYEGLQRIHWLKPYPSQANFILCKVEGKDARQVKIQLEKAGILVRYFNKPGLLDHIRISVGKPEHSDAILARLAELE